MRNLYKVGQNTGRLLSPSATSSSPGCCCARPTSRSPRWPASRAGATGDFYTGKVAAARFFARQVLPLLSAQRAIAEGIDNALMDLPESSAF